MKGMMLAAVGVVACLGARADADNVYMISSADGPTDAAAVAALTGHGHTVTVGVDYTLFDGSVALAGFDTVYLQCNANWTNLLLMPEAGQQQLIAWVNAGGRLVTSEWVVYYTSAGAKFGTLASIIPAEQSFGFSSQLSTTYSQVTPDPAINAGLPASFAFPLFSYTGTENPTVAKAGATTYYDTSTNPGSAGLCGWAIGSGSVYSFLSTCGPDQVADANFGRLFANVMGDTGGTCYPDCNLSGTLTLGDFGCFQSKYVLGDLYADCNASGTLSLADFGCFQGKYVVGCP